MTIDDKILFVLDVWWIWVFSVKNAHLNASREVSEQIAKGLLNSSALLFIHKQTKIRLCYPAAIFMLCLPRIMLQCVQFVRWWQRHGLWSMQGLFVFLLLISLIISPYIIFNKFLKICWCMLISARDGELKPPCTLNCHSPFFKAKTGEICCSVQLYRTQFKCLLLLY